MLVFFLPCLLFMGAWYLLLTCSHWENIGILNFQVQKLIKFRSKHFKILFIGDSSGGNAIETDDNNSINLCLSGSYGFEGTRAFIKVIDQYITYDTLVVINTIDMCTRPVSDEAKWLPNLYSGKLSLRCAAYKNSLLFFKPVIKNWFTSLTSTGASNVIADNDYPGTLKRINKTRNEFDTTINLKEVAELKMLDQDLKAKAETTYLLFGPSLPFDSAYFARVMDVLHKSDIRHRGNVPFALTEENKGDSEDHVHPGFSHLSTSYYLGIIRSGGTGR